MLYIFIKTDNIAAAFYILNIINAHIFTLNKTNVTEKSPSQEANSFSATHSIPVFFFTEHVGSLIFPPQPDSHPLT
jgi:hypothetical protein